MGRSSSSKQENGISGLDVIGSGDSGSSDASDVSAIGVESILSLFGQSHHLLILLIRGLPHSLG
jgi:hypothetical protein